MNWVEVDICSGDKARHLGRIYVHSDSCAFYGVSLTICIEFIDIFVHMTLLRLTTSIETGRWAFCLGCDYELVPERLEVYVFCNFSTAYGLIARASEHFEKPLALRGCPKYSLLQIYRYWYGPPSSIVVNTYCPMKFLVLSCPVVRNDALKATSIGQNGKKQSELQWSHLHLNRSDAR